MTTILNEINNLPPYFRQGNPTNEQYTTSFSSIIGSPVTDENLSEYIQTNGIEIFYQNLADQLLKTVPTFSSSLLADKTFQDFIYTIKDGLSNNKLFITNLLSSQPEAINVDMMTSINIKMLERTISPNYFSLSEPDIYDYTNMLYYDLSSFIRYLNLYHNIDLGEYADIKTPEPEEGESKSDFVVEITMDMIRKLIFMTLIVSGHTSGDAANTLFERRVVLGEFIQSIAKTPNGGMVVGAMHKMLCYADLLLILVTHYEPFTTDLYPADTTNAVDGLKGALVFGFEDPFIQTYFALRDSKDLLQLSKEYKESKYYEKIRSVDADDLSDTTLDMFIPKIHEIADIDTAKSLITKEVIVSEETKTVLETNESYLALAASLEAAEDKWQIENKMPASGINILQRRLDSLDRNVSMVKTNNTSFMFDYLLVSSARKIRNRYIGDSENSIKENTGRLALLVNEEFDFNEDIAFNDDSDGKGNFTDIYRNIKTAYDISNSVPINGVEAINAESFEEPQQTNNENNPRYVTYKTAIETYERLLEKNEKSFRNIVRISAGLPEIIEAEATTETVTAAASTTAASETTTETVTAAASTMAASETTTETAAADDTATTASDEPKVYTPIANRVKLDYEESNVIWKEYEDKINFMEENFQQQCAIYDHSIANYKSINNKLEENITWLNTEIKNMDVEYREQNKEDEEMIKDLEKQHKTEIDSFEAVNTKMKTYIATFKFQNITLSAPTDIVVQAPSTTNNGFIDKILSVFIL